MKIVCVIPIKLNNVRLPNKNIKKLHGQPLCSYIFNTIRNVKIIHETYCFCSNTSIKEYLPTEISYLIKLTSKISTYLV